MVNKLLLNIVVEYYTLDVEIIFSWMKIVERMSIKGGLRSWAKVHFFEYSRLKKFYSLNILTDLIVGVWSTGKAPFIPVEQRFGEPSGDKLKRSSTRRLTEVSQREHLAPTVGLDKTWSHPYSQLSILHNEKHEASTVGIWRTPPCNK